MFTENGGYGGVLDDESERLSGPWYSLTWGCIHLDVLYYWKAYSRPIRFAFWAACWNWIAAFGRRPFDTGIETRLMMTAFFDPVPVKQFARAVQRLMDKGFLEKSMEMRGEHETEVFTPTRALADRLLSVVSPNA